MSTAALPMLERFDASRLRTARKLESEIHVLPADVEALRASLTRDIAACLQPVEASVRMMKELVDRDFGVLEGFSEDRRRDKLNAAMKESGLAEAIASLPKAVATCIQKQGKNLLERKLDLARSIVAEQLVGDLPATVNDRLLASFGRHVQTTLTREHGASVRVEDAGLGRSHLLDSLAIVAARRVMVALAQKLGQGLLRNVFAKAAGRLAVGEWIAMVPGGWLLDAVLLVTGGVWDIVHVGSDTREHVKQSFDRLLEEECRRPLEAELPTLVDQMRATLEEQISAVRVSSKELLESEWGLIFLHANSDGLADYARGKSADDVEASLVKVARAFGRRYAHTNFVQKLQMVASVPRVGDLLSRYGDAFVDLYGRRPEALTYVASAAPAPLLDHVLTAASPETELVAVHALVRRVGTLTDGQVAAVRLLRRLNATSDSLANVSGAQLASLASGVDDLERLRATDSVTALGLTLKILEGEVSSDAWRTALARSHGTVLVRVLTQLGPNAYRDLVRAASEDVLANFVRQFDSEAAMDMLRTDGARYLAIYRTPDVGGVRGVRIWQKLRTQYGGNTSADTYATALWAIEHLDVGEEVIDKALIQDLKAVHITAQPALLARMVARTMRLIGLGGLEFLAAFFALCVLLVVLGVLKPFRILHAMWCWARGRSESLPASTEVAHVQVTHILPPQHPVIGTDQILGGRSLRAPTPGALIGPAEESPPAEPGPQDQNDREP